MDAAAGFPPHPDGWSLPPRDRLILLDDGFRGRVLGYDALIEKVTMQPSHAFTLFPGVCPGWDNEPRRTGCGTGFIGSTPRKYGAWLEHSCRRALQAANPDERIVFINAWNEWAEGAYLEPDRHYGYAYLRETARVLGRLARPADTETPAAALLSEKNRMIVPPRPPINGLIRSVRRRAANAVEALAEALRPD
jgi:lipopolysaccharide biosynthesis protein